MNVDKPLSLFIACLLLCSPLICGCGSSSDSSYEISVKKIIPYAERIRILENEETGTKDPSELSRIRREKEQAIKEAGEVDGSYVTEVDENNSAVGYNVDLVIKVADSLGIDHGIPPKAEE